MAMEFARAFIDLHHTVSEETIYLGNDFPLVVDDGTGSPAIHPDLANNVRAWNLTATQIQNLGILRGWATRSLNFAGGVDNTIPTRQLKRVAYLIMGRDPSTGEIDPTWAMRSPSQGNQLVIDFDTNGDAAGIGDNAGGAAVPLFGGFFCDNNGIPKKVSLDGSDRIMFGISISSPGAGNGLFLSTMNKGGYPPSPDDTIQPPFNGIYLTRNNPPFDFSGDRRRIIIDRDSNFYADIINNADETLTGPFGIPDSDVDILFDRNSQNINIIPAMISRNVSFGGQFDRKPDVDFDWDIYYRNRSDA